MKGYLIDSAARKIRAVDYDYSGPRGISALAGFGRSGFCIGWRWVCGDVLYVDDEGLMKPAQHWFRMNRRPDGQPYAGNGFVTGPDTLDSTAPPSMTPADILAEITWLSDAKARKWLQDRANQPAVTMTSNAETSVIATWASLTPPRA
jgi:hypothetical protein